MSKEENQIRIIKNESSHASSRIFSRHEFFQCEEVVVSVTDDKITITKPTIDFIGRTSKCTTKYIRKTSDHKQICVGVVLPYGRYLIDEEDSNEDRIVIFFEDKIED